ncbi:exosortase F system-associated protein [Flavobacterium sp. UMI-01]|uniref:exosortase F system-associated membrane protein n=1 Tax=Flavobacterium sp. UMI-01 TaxID=1441053 RepID=UPI001C7CCE55|nr:exosortase F system-associated protein [Flavobacterium sp. UMI-01]GIZ08923.1 exosortase F system-associated protein [Flavobacterium sp. UMI-01]
MLKKILKYKIRFLLGGLLVFLLVLVRVFEKDLFYDPFLIYFEGDFKNLPLPAYHPVPLFLGLMFRYGLNMVISLALLYVLFRKIDMVKFSFFLYILFFVVLIIGFFGVIYLYGAQNNLMLFYVRRFLIQPLFVLLFIPGFYYQSKNK